MEMYNLKELKEMSKEEFAQHFKKVRDYYFDKLCVIRDFKNAEEKEEKNKQEEQNKPFKVWVRYKNIDSDGYDTIQWSNNYETIKDLKGFYCVTVNNYNDLADRLEKDFTMKTEILNSIRNHDRMRTTKDD